MQLFLEKSLFLGLSYESIYNLPFLDKSLYFCTLLIKSVQSASLNTMIEGQMLLDLTACL